MGTMGWVLAGALAGVDPTLLASLCFTESNHNPKAYVHHDGGSPSYGICQVKLSTARDMGFTGEAAELMEPNTNALYAAKYLAYQKERFGTWERAVSAFNCGRPCGNAAYVDKVMKGAGNDWRK